MITQTLLHFRTEYYYCRTPPSRKYTNCSGVNIITKAVLHFRTVWHCWNAAAVCSVGNLDVKHVLPRTVSTGFARCYWQAPGLYPTETNLLLLLL